MGAAFKEFAMVTLRMLISSLTAAALVAGCTGNTPSTPSATVAIDPAFEEAAPEVAAKLRSSFSGVVAITDDAPLTVVLNDGGAKLVVNGPQPLMDRRDPVFGDTIDLSSDNQEAIARVIATRGVAMTVAGSRDGSNEALTEDLRALTKALLPARADINLESELGHDLADTYRQAQFQLMSETRSNEDLEALKAFEAAEEDAGRGIKGPT